MNYICRIRPELLDKYCNREGLKRIGLIFGIGIIIVIVLMVFLISSGIPKELLYKFPLFMLGIFTLVGFITFPQFKNMAKHTVFVFSPDGIGRIVKKENLNLMNQLGAARNEMHGGKTSDFIHRNEIRTVKITEKSIKIYSRNYNFLFGTGLINFPIEAEHYAEIVEKIEDYVNDKI